MIKWNAAVIADFFTSLQPPPRRQHSYFEISDPESRLQNKEKKRARKTEGNQTTISWLRHNTAYLKAGSPESESVRRCAIGYLSRTRQLHRCFAIFRPIPRGGVIMIFRKWERGQIFKGRVPVRRICCVGQRGSPWSPGLSLRTRNTSTNLLHTYLYVLWRGTILGSGGDKGV